jgi:diacylglycerol O-acyltransferase
MRSEATAATGAVAAAAGTPRDIVILSAAMGDGHNAAARAIADAMRDQWPGCAIEQLDIMELRGRRFAETVRQTYNFQLRVIPGTYQWLYDVLCRSDLFASALKHGFGWFFGRRLARTLSARRPDLIVSTYPLASGALDWLRSSRGYRVPTVTYVPAFHVHPLWTYPGIDLHFVMYESAAGDARTRGIDHTMVVGAPPVRRGFGARSRAEARAELGLAADAFVVLMTGGAWGLGSLEQGVEALAALPDESTVQVIVVCGRNESLRRRLEDLGVAPERLRVLGYVDTMPTLMAASDVVVTNGAGVTILEALRTPRPVVALEPLAGHGRAATLVMEELDLAIVCERPADLSAAVRHLSSDGQVLSRLEQAGRDYVRGKDLADSVRSMAALVAERRGVGDSSGPAGGAAQGSRFRLRRSDLWPSRPDGVALRRGGDGLSPASANRTRPASRSGAQGGNGPHREQPGS